MHIWNIFCTFAADLGIVPSVIVNKFCNMMKECIFKVYAKGKIWYVYEVSLSGVNLTKVYRVYCGRRWHEHIAFYHARFAVEACMIAALGCTVHIVGEIEL